MATLVRWFTHWKWWFSIVYSMFTRPQGVSALVVAFATPDPRHPHRQAGAWDQNLSVAQDFWQETLEYHGDFFLEILGNTGVMYGNPMGLLGLYGIMYGIMYGIIIAGWRLTYPSENDGVSNTWDDDMPNIFHVPNDQPDNDDIMVLARPSFYC